MEEPQNPEGRLDRRRASRVLQPDEGLAAGLDALITRIERVEPAAREEQLARDRDLLLRLQLCGFKGRVWDEKEHDLYQYGRKILPAKIRSGEIFAIMRDLGVPEARDLRLPSGPPLTPEERTDLALDVMAIALPRFKELLKSGGWDGSREHVACIDSFFIGKCALEFRAPWRRFLRAWRRRLAAERAVLPYDAHPADDRASDAVVTRVDLVRALDRMPDDDLRLAIVLDACQWTDAEIAVRLGITPKAVEYRLLKARSLLRNLRDQVG